MSPGPLLPQSFSLCHLRPPSWFPSLFSQHSPSTIRQMRDSFRLLAEGKALALLCSESLCSVAHFIVQINRLGAQCEGVGDTLPEALATGSSATSSCTGKGGSPSPTCLLALAWTHPLTPGQGVTACSAAQVHTAGCLGLQTVSPGCCRSGLLGAAGLRPLGLH